MNNILLKEEKIESVQSEKNGYFIKIKEFNVVLCLVLLFFFFASTTIISSANSTQPYLGEHIPPELRGPLNPPDPDQGPINPITKGLPNNKLSKIWFMEYHASQSIDLLHQIKFATLFFGND